VPALARPGLRSPLTPKMNPDRRRWEWISPPSRKERSAGSLPARFSMVSAKRCADKLSALLLAFLVQILLPFCAVPQCAAVDQTPKAAGQTNSTPNRAPAVKLERPGVKNLYQVAPGLYRCAQPTARGMRELEALGIKTVINLRPFHSDKDEAKGTSLKRERISFKTWHPEDSDVIRFLKIVSDTNRAPFAVHCLHGSDRTGMMIAIYRIAFEGWTKDEAIAEMTGPDFGFHEIWQNLIRYLRALDVGKIKRKAGIK